MQPSPYTPGQVSRDVPGRSMQLAEVDERLAYMVGLKRLVGRVRVDTGPRGVGKTSLLRAIQRQAESRNLLTVWVTAGDPGRPLAAAIADEINTRTTSWSKAARRRLALPLSQLKVSAGVPGVAGVEATLGAPSPPPASFKSLILNAAAGAVDQGRAGLVVLIDEIQDADQPSLRTLAISWQDLQAEAPDLPAAVFAAGLPESPEVIAAAATFSERFAYRPLDRLDAEASELVVRQPAAASGVTWTEDAVALVLTQAAGYPYALQVAADAAWAAAGRPDPRSVITADHVRAAAEAIDADMRGLFRARWNKATNLEQLMMTAIAFAEVSTGGPVARGLVAHLMGRDTRAVSTGRATLIDKGFIASPRRGLIEFTSPGFGRYVLEQGLVHLLNPDAALLARAGEEQPSE